MGTWDVLAEILSGNHSISVDERKETIIITDNKGKTIFIDKTKDGGTKLSSAPFNKEKKQGGIL